jgi:hypothetical protein
MGMVKFSQSRDQSVRVMGIIAGCLAGALVATPVGAQITDQSGRNEATTKAAASPEVSAVRTIEAATNLADWSRANRDADGLITAAQMLKSVPTTEGTVTGTLEGPVATTPAPNRPVMTSTSLLAEARSLARGDRGVLARIRAVETSASRGVVSSAFGRGAIRTVRDVSANSTWRFSVDARGGSSLRVLAIGDGDTDVDMVMRDQNGNVVCRDLDVDERALCDITPAWSGRFTIEVINTGSVWTRTMVISN